MTVELDELWSFLESKQQRQRGELAMDRNTREVVGLALGDRIEQAV
ncbi:MAG: hypothetical protein AAF889_10810 [Cyanobacteria bacterium P01_D01_bin.73]